MRKNECLVYMDNDSYNGFNFQQMFYIGLLNEILERDEKISFKKYELIKIYKDDFNVELTDENIIALLHEGMLIHEGCGYIPNENFVCHKRFVSVHNDIAWHFAENKVDIEIIQVYCYLKYKIKSRQYHNLYTNFMFSKRKIIEELNWEYTRFTMDKIGAILEFLENRNYIRIKYHNEIKRGCRYELIAFSFNDNCVLVDYNEQGEV